jgi:hypothetical protein
MLVQGVAVNQSVREGVGDKGPWRLAVVNVLDKTLNDLVECQAFLRDGEASPFVEIKDGSQVSLPIRRCTVYKFRVQADVAR